jgi:hypothetical protein
LLGEVIVDCRGAAATRNHFGMRSPFRRMHSAQRSRRDVDNAARPPPSQTAKPSYSCRPRPSPSARRTGGGSRQESCVGICGRERCGGNYPHAILERGAAGVDRAMLGAGPMSLSLSVYIYIYIYIYVYIYVYNLYPSTTYRLGALDITQPTVGNQ